MDCTRTATTAVIGSDETLGIELSAQLLCKQAGPVVWLITRPTESTVAGALFQQVEERVRDWTQVVQPGPVNTERLNIALLTLGEPQQFFEGDELLKMEDVWILPGGLHCLDHLADTLPGIGPARVFVIEGPQGGEADTKRLVDSCIRNRIVTTQFQIPYVFGDRFVRPDSPGCSALPLLRKFDEVVVEAQARIPDYFDHCALRVPVDEGATLDVMTVQEAVSEMLVFVDQSPVGGESRQIHARSGMPVEEFLGDLGEAWGISAIGVPRANQAGTVHWFSYKHASQADSPPATRSTTPARRAELLRTLRGVSRKLSDARQDRDGRVSGMPAAFEEKRVEIGGRTRTYYRTGRSGAPVMFLNALGQGLRYWYRVVDCLREKHIVLLWEPGGLTADSPPLRLRDHLDDIESILDAEGLKECFLVGWCNGAQIGAEFCAERSESVVGMVCVNCGLKFSGRPDLDTSTESTIEKLSTMLVGKPTVAQFVMTALVSVNQPQGASRDGGDILSIANTDLRLEVCAPFRNEQSTFRYAEQVLDLLSVDTLSKGKSVRTPLLFLGCEFDHVAKPDKAFESAKYFPNSRPMVLAGATHYVLYDRPVQVTEILEDFFQQCQGASATRSAG